MVGLSVKPIVVSTWMAAIDLFSNCVDVEELGYYLFFFPKIHMHFNKCLCIFSTKYDLC